MTVLRGEVAVIRANGQAIQPAPSGTVVNSGDELRTLTKAGALITFFTGTEIELGEGTILVVDTVSRNGNKIDVSLRQVLGVTVNRVQAFTDPGSSYRIDAGGAVAVVRGTTFALVGPVPTTQGNIVAFVCLDDCTPQTTFSGCAASPYSALGVTVEKGKASSGCESTSVAKTGDYFNSAFEVVTAFEQTFAGGNAGQAALGTTTGSARPPEGNSGADKSDKKDDKEEDQNSQGNNAPLFAGGGTACTRPGITFTGAPGSSEFTVTQRDVGGGQFEYTFTVNIRGGQPGKRLEAFIFFSSPFLLGHQKVGDITLDSQGNANLTGTIRRQGPERLVDAETNTPGTTDIGLGRVGDHVYIAFSLQPCTV